MMRCIGTTPPTTRRLAGPLATIALALVGLVLAAPAFANHIAPTLMIDVVGGDPGTQVNSLGTSQTVGDVTTWTLSAPATIEGATIDSWTAELKEDPFVTNNIVVTNTTAFTQTFIATVLLPIPAFNYDQVINSSIGVTVTDSNGDGILSFANSGTAIYQGIVDLGTPGALTLLSLDPNFPGTLPITTADCPVPFAGCTATSSAGVAAQAAGPGSASSIAIVLRFDLSAGDSAGLTSRFEIVPEPGSAGLLGLGLLVLAARPGQRRRTG